MKANRAYELIVAREGRGPAFLAAPDRTDRIEVVEIDSGEAVLFWELEPRAASRLARALREDMGRLEADDFIAAWRAAQERGGR
ncbi:hypothetical protein [Conexibacter sp. CPCC 206217]|uniref:hypothetical protein n=1 Tax=Conexibacter sp. CPCC 206217 TaxID=3064574 RepID=UPI0027236F1D|nr:hypothetical protein [Conexibacter sp. CPCC 206217]MDO8213823.1 hypothetical protein [Conexibacter sp. CPCC 206217]